MVLRRTSCTSWAAAGLFGGRNTAVVSSPNFSAQIAGNSQFAKWAEKISPGRPSSRIAKNCSSPRTSMRWVARFSGS